MMYYKHKEREQYFMTDRDTVTTIAVYKNQPPTWGDIAEYAFDASKCNPCTAKEWNQAVDRCIADSVKHIEKLRQRVDFTEEIKNSEPIESNMNIKIETIASDAESYDMGDDYTVNKI